MNGTAKLSIKRNSVKNYFSLKELSASLISISLLTAPLVCLGQTPPLTPSAQNSSHPAAQRISQDLQERERKLKVLLAKNPSLTELDAIWEDARLLENSIRKELSNAGVNDNDATTALSNQYMDHLQKIFNPLVALYRTTIEQFSFEKNDGSSLSMSLEVFRSRVPQAWDPEVAELKSRWLAKLNGRDYQPGTPVKATQVAATKDPAATARAISRVIQKHRAKITSLNLSPDFLKATLQISHSGQNISLRPFEEWIALVIDNPAIENVTGIAMKDRRERGVRVKTPGSPSTGLLFTLDGKDLYLTYVADHTDRIYPVRTSAEKMQLAIKMLEWSELNLNNRLNAYQSSPNK